MRLSVDLEGRFTGHKYLSCESDIVKTKCTKKVNNATSTINNMYMYEASTITMFMINKENCNLQLIVEYISSLYFL